MTDSSSGESARDRSGSRPDQSDSSSGESARDRSGSRPDHSGNSALDRVDLARVRAAADTLRGTFRVPLACLLIGKILDARVDRLVTGGARATADVAVALSNARASSRKAALAADRDAAVGVAVGLVLAGRLSGGNGAVWVLLDPQAADDGGTWEALLAAVSAGAGGPTVVSAGGTGDTDRLQRLAVTAGWRVLAAEEEPAEVLAGMDRALRTAEPTLLAINGPVTDHAPGRVSTR